MSEYLDSLGVEGAMVLAECGPGTKFSIDSKLIAEYCAGEARLVPFGNINPNFHDCVEEFERSRELEVRGFKFYPADHAFDPMTGAMREVYRRCEALGMPVIFHTGLTAQKNTEQQHIRPREFEVLAQDYPDLIMILAHTGNPYWHNEALDLAAKYRWVYVDTGLVPVEEWPRIYGERPDASTKVLFGSDFPVCGSYRKLLERIQNAEISPQLKEAILLQNGMTLIEHIEARQGETLLARAAAA